MLLDAHRRPQQQGGGTATGGKLRALGWCTAACRQLRTTLDRLMKGEAGPEGRRLTRVGALNPVSANKPTSTGSVDVMHVCGFSNSIGIERGAVDPALRRPRHLAPMQRAMGLQGGRPPPACSPGPLARPINGARPLLGRAHYLKGWSAFARVVAPSATATAAWQRRSSCGAMSAAAGKKVRACPHARS